jgi:hypothetical protein
MNRLCALCWPSQKGAFRARIQLPDQYTREAVACCEQPTGTPDFKNQLSRSRF